MERRKFLKGSTLLSGLLAFNPFEVLGNKSQGNPAKLHKKARNIIFMISDGMSSGTLAMDDLYSRNILGRSSNWMNFIQKSKKSTIRWAGSAWTIPEIT